ncbi:MAG: hypothetical protein K8R02_05345 [Anaerohalosphaeraceae bacterium]|nr:hypothetical protein [Anaerohalosphaeraceae bacterium]
MRYFADKKNSGVALIIVLALVMTITIVSLGFIVRGDVELLCGVNTEFKAQMDCLAESGLEHARGLLLNPQDVSGEYWTGNTGLQLVSGSSDYYDVNVTRIDFCNYQITSTGYRVRGGQRIAKSSLTAELRLDACFGLRTGDDWSSKSNTIVNGDIYCKGDISGWADIKGDAYAKKNITAANVAGSETENVLDGTPPVPLPGLSVSDFDTSYRIGSTVYSVGSVGSPLNGQPLGPTAGNPAGVYYCNGNLEIQNDVTINGTLVVDGNLKITGTNNTITATKNFPAVITSENLKMCEDSELTIEGLAYIDDWVKGDDDPEDATLVVVGALFMKKKSIGSMADGSNTITITACADRAAYKFWTDSSSYDKWSPAAGAFFKNIEKTQ